jgi:GT2 family glycosyltransferase/glycosyltransferase involved in cell wall biosynthesis
MKKDIFATAHAPYYLVTPPYVEGSGGVRAMHYFCHALNLAGEEAYVNTSDVLPGLRTPALTDEVREKHSALNLEPIVVYPEIVPDNPLAAKHVVRYLLNTPGVVTTQETNWGADDIIFSFGKVIIPEGMDAHILEIPLINTRIYNTIGADNSQRHGKLVFINRYLDRGGELDAVTADATEISFRAGFRSPQQLASLYKHAEVLYAYEPSTACFEALLCGCPVVYLPNPLLLPKPFEGYLGNDGCAWGTDPEALELAKKAVHKATENYAQRVVRFGEQLENFISITQAAVQSKDDTSVASAANPIDRAYQKWLENRTFCPEDVARLDQKLSATDGREISFNIFIRLDPGAETLLADTLDSLGQQVLASWQLDVVTTLPAPEGITDVACVGWHTLPSMEKSKNAIDNLATQQNHLWNIEIPAGAWLDPLFLWRLAKEAQFNPDAVAFFVDDDCHDDKGTRLSPRLKPGVNQARMLASDLAGPLCVHRNAWLATEGASRRSGSPWFSQLLRITDKFGWPSIRHTPDVLISYPGEFPSEIEACLIGLVENQMRKGIASEVVPVTGQSWNIRFPLTTTPTITIAIISQGQLDFLPRCFDSVIEKTNYPDFEIIIALTTADDDPDLNSWLENAQRGPLPAIRVIRTSAAANHAVRCNTAVQASSNDFVLLIREEAVIIQDKWLDELVRTCLQPDIAAAAPCLITPGTGQIQEAGSVLGLEELVGSPYQQEAKLGASGYLDILRVARDASVLSGACLLIRRASYLAVDGMDEGDLGDHFSDADLCQKIRGLNQRLVYQPLATAVYGGPTSLDIGCDIEGCAQDTIAEARATKVFSQRWLTHSSLDPFWNLNLSLNSATPTPETDYRAQWQYLPSSAPRILARPLMNGQGIFRLTAPLTALRKAGMVTECVWPQMERGREPSASEILRLAPDSVIVQHYLNNPQLPMIEAWQALPSRPFLVYALDDLLTNMAESNHLRKNVPANARSRLKYALARCDRMVVSTDFLADAYRHLIPDIRVVPNRLEQALWLPVNSRTRTSAKPRIGWAGGTTHQGDLILLKEIIEQTRHEADWVFFGMCPKEIRPLIAEYHAFGPYPEYPARLAALNLDIAVAPLAQIPFNQGKSNLRLLEYGVLGIPVVCTDIDPYQGSPACCVANTVEAWTNALRERIHDADAREREGRALRQWVQSGYLLENHLEEWLSAHLPG